MALGRGEGSQRHAAVYVSVTINDGGNIMLKSCLTALAALVLVALPISAQAGDYPERPVQMMVPFAPGGGPIW